MQGAKNSNLTTKGIEEAKLLGKSLKNTNFDMIYSSPLGRTIETMKHIKGDRNIPIKYMDELKEMNFGDLEGKIVSEAEKEYGDLVYKLWKNPANYDNPKGENYDELFIRVRKALDNIISKNDYDRVMVVTHGVIIAVLFALIEGREIKDIWNKPVVKNTSVSIFKVDGNRSIKVIKENDISHLEVN